MVSSCVRAEAKEAAAESLRWGGGGGKCQEEAEEAPGVKSQRGRLVSFFTGGVAATGRFTWVRRPRRDGRAEQFAHRVSEGWGAHSDTV